MRQPDFIFWSTLIASGVILSALPLSTIWLLVARRASGRWWLALILVIAAAIPAGLYCAALTYKIDEARRLRGVPIPVADLNLADGKWIETTSPNLGPLILANVATITLLSLLPLFLATALALRRPEPTAPPDAARILAIRLALALAISLSVPLCLGISQYFSTDARGNPDSDYFWPDTIRISTLFFIAGLVVGTTWGRRCGNRKEDTGSIG